MLHRELSMISEFFLLFKLIEYKCGILIVRTYTYKFELWTNSSRCPNKGFVSWKNNDVLTYRKNMTHSTCVSTHRHIYISIYREIYILMLLQIVLPKEK